MTTLTEIFPCFFLSCKANARVKPAKMGHGPHSFNFCVVLCTFCVVLCIVCFVTYSALYVCKCVLNYCHRVATQLQLNISYIISNQALNSIHVVVCLCCLVFPARCSTPFFSASSHPSHTEHILPVLLYFRLSTFSSTSQGISLLYIFPPQENHLPYRLMNFSVSY